jgi:hypothetical protein
VVHGFHHQRETGGPIIPLTGNQPDAHGIAARHEAVAIMFDFVNPVSAGWGLVGGGRHAGFNEARPVSGKTLTHYTHNRHATNVGAAVVFG